MFAAITMSAVLVLGTIILHFTALRVLALRMNDEVRVFKRPLVAVLLVLFATHLVEVLLYALGFLALEVLGVGHLATIDAAVAVPFDDFFYFSIACYTTLGIGDIVPHGATRLLAGIEALNGLVLITWSASFTYLMMERLWSSDMEKMSD